MRTPRPASIELAHTKLFIRQIVPDSQPILIPYEPLAGKPLLECFSIVPEHIVSHGGKQLTGWAIWETPGLFIEAEFHAVWQDNEGRLHDLTPRPVPLGHILFLPDPGREYTGRQVDNIRRALVDDLDVIRFLHLFKRRFEILNKGDLADQYGEIELSPRAAKEYRKLEKEMAQLNLRLSRRYP